jgi:methylamine dehydrogenase accessory protein MauD
MMLLLIISEVLLLLAVVALTLIVFALARQIGVLHERLAPLGAQEKPLAVTEGQEIPRVTMKTPEGQKLVIGDRLETGTYRAILFVASDCPICKRVMPAFAELVGERVFNPVFVADGPLPEIINLRERAALPNIPFVTGPELALTLQVARLPTLVILDDRGALRVREIVNTRAQIETLIGVAKYRTSADTDMDTPNVAA